MPTDLRQRTCRYTDFAKSSPMTGRFRVDCMAASRISGCKSGHSGTLRLNLRHLPRFYGMTTARQQQWQRWADHAISGAVNGLFQDGLGSTQLEGLHPCGRCSRSRDSAGFGRLGNPPRDRCGYGTRGAKRELSAGLTACESRGIRELWVFTTLVGTPQESIAWKPAWMLGLCLRL